MLIQTSSNRLKYVDGRQKKVTPTIKSAIEHTMNIDEIKSVQLRNFNKNVWITSNIGATDTYLKTFPETIISARYNG